MSAAPTTGVPVHVVDADPGTRESVSNLLRSAGYRVVVHASPDVFLGRPRCWDPGCVILDIRPGSPSGLACQDRLRDGMPVILMTRFADVPSAVRVIKAGAVDCLEKPVDEQALLAAVREALARAAARAAAGARLAEARSRYATLTSREKEVMQLVASGLMNKQVAGRLSLSEVTVKMHRGSVMRKMGLRTLADLVRVADLLNDDAPDRDGSPGFALSSRRVRPGAAAPFSDGPG